MSDNSSQTKPDFDAIVVGTGFAGAVTACRLVEAGLRICVLERGRRYGPDDFPVYPTASLTTDEVKRDLNSYDPPPDISRWFWNVGQGLWDIRDLGQVVVGQAAGYGGGSLIYANVHLRAPKEVFDRHWPACYRRGPDRLDPYYDLAAYMLDVNPIPQDLDKTIQLHRGAAAIGREGHWFKPPLAINFSKNGLNKFDREQKCCDLRGQCWQGCGAQAKNTLDLNYLAIVEDSALADIRTLAEVEHLACAKNGIYSVKYYNHLTKTRDENVTARYVFLCAGAVNTTELIMRNKENLNLPDNIKSSLGTRYHPNADSFAMVFNCDETHEADYGPTITSALLCEEKHSYDVRQPSVYFYEGEYKPEVSDTIIGEESGASGLVAYPPILSLGTWKTQDADGVLMLNQVRGVFKEDEFFKIKEKDKRIGRINCSADKLRDWFLVEEGGFPTDLEPLLGIFRSPLWLGRNRFSETDPTSSESEADPTRYENEGKSYVHSPAQLPRRAMVGALTGLPIGAMPSTGILGRTFNQYHGILARKLHSEVLKLSIWNMLPEWLRTAVQNDFEQLQDSLAFAAEPLVSMWLDQAIEPLIKQIDLGEIGKGLEVGEIKESDLRMIVRGLVRQGIQLMWGSEVDLTRNISKFLLDKLPQNLDNLIDLLPHLLSWALDYRTGDGRTAMLLTMGRDLFPGNLFIEEKNSKLKAHLPKPHLPNSWQTQEKVLREIASNGWKGELRTDPAWPFLNRRVTVHSQGGCPMVPTVGSAAGLARGVTEPCGQVFECPGLYVMDAAAFPTPVGVNPSATIAAIAEYKIERFIQGLGSKEKRFAGLENWEAGQKGDASAWAKKNQHVLDPIGEIEKKNSGQEHASNVSPLGLSFEETMEGFYSIDDKKIDWDDLTNFQKTIGYFEDAEARGVVDGHTIKTNLTAKITNLAQFLAESDADHVGKISISGTLTMTEFSALEEVTGYLQMFLPAGPNSHTRYFYYLLDFQQEDTSYRIRAFKIVRDDPGFDVWKDTATLYFDYFKVKDDNEEALEKRGLLRIPAAKFLNQQVKSFKITNTDDPARKKWALAAFGKYFFGNLVKVYLPELARGIEAGKNFLKHTHG
ncbi:MAG TPA: GMC oxidoreductase [Nitrospirales bacterium]|nr:hypothetical protein [Nitrospiraceae bacterium]HNP29026.1 GMC oxidoreductase [Nitrospirales bacterium]